MAENIGFGLIIRDTPGSEVRARVERAGSAVGCSDLLDRRPHELSGGERQRVALARALVREPDVFLFDEPLSNLDAELRVRMRGELRELHRRVGGTTIYVTHDQVEAMVLGDRIAVMADGALQQVGTPEEVWRTPANRLVARFVGSPPINFLPGDGPLRVEGIPHGPGVELAVRPEHLVLGPDGSPWTVAFVETVGSDAYVHLRAGDAELVARVDVGARPAPGEAIRVSVRSEDVHLFDVGTGERVSWR